MVIKGTKAAFLFPGQGAQYPGMALDLLDTGSGAVRALFDLASEIMGRDMRALMRDSDAETLKRSDIAQPAITLANLAAAALLRERGILPSACAGHSLGEYAALATAGVIDTETALRLVALRGRAMQDAADRLEAGGGAASGSSAVGGGAAGGGGVTADSGSAAVDGMAASGSNAAAGGGNAAVGGGGNAAVGRGGTAAGGGNAAVGRGGTAAGGGNAVADGGNAAAGRGGTAAGMAAVMGLAPEVVEGLIARWSGEGLEGLYGANYNSPRQVVISGTAAALEVAEARFKEAGARRVLRLQVAGPFHSPLMAEAAAAFAPALEAALFADPAIVLYSNVTGQQIRTGDEAKRLAIRQITEPVRWTLEEAALAARGDIGAVLEAGPGKVLQGLWKDAGSGIPCFGAGTLAEIEALA